MYPISKPTSKRFFILILLTLTPLFAGCAKIDAQITLNQDGSGKIIITELLTEEGRNRIAMLSNSRKIPTIDIIGYFTQKNEKELAKGISYISNGITYNSIKIFKLANGSIGKSTTYTFKDINKVILFNRNSGNKENLKFEFNGTILKIYSKLNNKEKTDITNATKLLGSIPSIIKEAFNNMRINITLNTEQKFKTTSASYPNMDRNIITFLNVDIGKLIATPEVINTLVKLDKIPKEKRYRTLEPFNSWLKIEIEDTITVSF